MTLLEATGVVFVAIVVDVVVVVVIVIANVFVVLCLLFMIPFYSVVINECSFGAPYHYYCCCSRCCCYCCCFCCCWCFFNLILLLYLFLLLLRKFSCGEWFLIWALWRLPLRFCGNFILSHFHVKANNSCIANIL